MDGTHVHAGAASATTWTATAGESWLGAATSFLVMWVAMTAAMMLPSMAPTLWRYRQMLAGAGAMRAGALTVLVGGAYLFVWTGLGAAAFLFGVAWANARVLSPELTRAAPIASGVVVLIAGVAQLTRWKARRLARCRLPFAPVQGAHAEVGVAWRYGLRLGRDCGLACAGAMASVLAIGVMDMRAMALATLAITAERLAPAGDRVARMIGLGAIALGSVLLARAAGAG